MAFISVLLQIFWQKFYRNVPGVVLYHPYELCQNHWFWLVSMATDRKAKFSKKKSIQKSFFSETIRGMKLKLCINVHDISLYINCIFIVVAHVLSLLWQLKFPYTCTYNGTSGNWHLFLCYCRYFDKSFTEMFLEYQPYEFCPNCWIWLVAKQQTFKNLLLRSHMGDEAETLHKCLWY